MIAGRWAALLGAALTILLAMGAMAAQMPASAQRVAVTSVVGFLAPLFWPGAAATAVGTARRIAAQSVSAAAGAIVLLLALGHPARQVWALLQSATVLMLLLVIAHASAAALEVRWQGSSGHDGAARESAGRSVSIALLVLGSLPLSMGPLAQTASHDYPWLIDAVIGASPLTHLAVASENDLLRNDWLYQHSNLASLQFSYPSLSAIAGSYGAACLLLMLTVLLRQHGRGRASASPTPFEVEKTR